MKKLIFIIALLIVTGGAFATTGAEKTDDSKKVSNYAKRQFAQNFGTATNVKWQAAEEYVKANFTLDGKKMSALYDLQGGFIGAIEYLAYEQIPVSTRTEIEKKYKDYSFSAAVKIVSRPSASDLNDVGTYWVNLSDDSKQLFVSISPSLEMALQKTTDLDYSAN